MLQNFDLRGYMGGKKTFLAKKVDYSVNPEMMDQIDQHFSDPSKYLDAGDPNIIIGN
jgi:hypothetical protein